METTYPAVGKSIIDAGDIIPETEEALKKALAEFKETFKVE
jgi:hypothetical protein